MADDTPPPSKKHRVIGWKPEATQAGPESERKLPRWITMLLGAGGVLVVLVALIGGFVVYRLVKMEREAAAATAAEQLSTGASLRAEFVGRSRAEFARETAVRGLEGIRKTPSNHPAVMRRLIELERRLLSADKAFGDANYGIAVSQFEGISGETKAFGSALEDMRKAREGYDRFLVDVNRVERLKSLAPDTFESALTSAGAARSFLEEGSFSLARQKIEEAATTLASIEKSIAARLEGALADGRSALARGDGEAAKEAFTRALELQQGNEFAIKSLERAKTIGQVFALNEAAQQAEAAARLEEAQASFEKAFALDGQSATAQAGISRLKAAIKKRDFENALAAAATAIEQKRWNDAIAAYENAQKLFPDDESVKTRLAETRVRQRESFIESSLASAYELERAYDWDGARRIYLDLLKFEADQKDAEEGLLRTGKVLRALLKFERLLDDARSHAQRANFQPAIAAFNEAMANKPAYLSLSPEQEQLRQLLEAQSRPVEVTLISDNRTYVTIQGVRLLGRFDRTSVPIMPGNYEVIGRRRGYSDVREMIQVRGGDTQPAITIVANTRAM